MYICEQFFSNIIVLSRRLNYVVCDFLEYSTDRWVIGDISTYIIIILLKNDI